MTNKQTFKFHRLALDRLPKDHFQRLDWRPIPIELSWIVYRAWQNLVRITEVFQGEESGETCMGMEHLKLHEIEQLATWVMRLEADFYANADAIDLTDAADVIDHECLSEEIPGYEHAFRKIKEQAVFNDDLKLKVLKGTGVSGNVTVSAAICAYALAMMDNGLGFQESGKQAEASTCFLSGAGAYSCGESYYQGSMGRSFTRLSHVSRGKSAKGNINKRYVPLNLKFWELCDAYKGKLNASHAGRKFAPEIDRLAEELGIKLRGDSIQSTLERWFAQGLRASEQNPDAEKRSNLFEIS